MFVFFTLCIPNIPLAPAAAAAADRDFLWLSNAFTNAREFSSAFGAHTSLLHHGDNRVAGLFITHWHGVEDMEEGGGDCENQDETGGEETHL
jgi:hypothetical protein